MSLDPVHLIAILAMAAATALTRVAGLWARRWLPDHAAVSAALNATPVAVLTALVAPAVLLGGPAGWIAGAATILAAWRLPLLAVVAVGTASAALARAVLG